MALLSLIPTPYKIGIAAVLATALIGGAYLKGYDKGKTDYAVLKAEITQQAKDQQKVDDAAEAKDKFVSKEIYNEAQQKLAAASSTIDDLTKRMSNTSIVTKQVSSTSCSTSKPDTVSNGSTVAGSNSGPTEAQGTTSTTVSQLDTETLRDVLQTGIDALNAELLWRDWQRQVQP